MKKLLTGALGLLLFFPLAAEARDAEDFLDAVEKSYQDDFVTAATADLSFDVNGEEIFWLGLDGKITKNGNSWAEEDQVSFVLDMTDQPFGQYDPAFLASGEATVSAIYNADTETFFFRADDFSFDVSEADELTERMIEGYAEIAEMFTGKNYILNLAALEEVMAEDPLMAMQMQVMQEQMSNPEEALVEMLDVLIRSNILIIEEEGRGYVMTLQENGSEINVEELADIVELLALPEEYRQMAREQMIANAEEVQAGYNMIRDYVDLEIVFNISSGRIVGTSGYFTFSMEDYGDTINLEVTMDSSVDYRNTEIRFPDPEDGVELHKIIDGMMAEQQIWYDRYSNDSYYEDDYYYDDYEYELYEEEVLEIENAGGGDDGSGYVAPTRTTTRTTTTANPDTTVAGYDSILDMYPGMK